MVGFEPDKLSFPYLDAAWSAKCQSSTAKLVLVSLADHANSDGVCWPSVARLGKRCGLGRRAVQHALRALEVAGLITTIPKTGMSSNYKLNLRLSDAPRASLRQNTCARGTPKPSVTAKNQLRSRNVWLEKPAPKSNASAEEIKRLIADCKESTL